MEAFLNRVRRGVRYILPLLVLSIMLPSEMPSAFAQSKRTPLYIGSDGCRGCHEQEYKSFMQYAKKSKSYSSIERVKKGLTQEEIRGCYACHTTGYGKQGGFISPEKTPHLKNAGCEVCHGPGEFHVRTRNPQYIKRKMTLKDCEVCHTSERVRAFNYKPLIHGGAH